LVNLTWKASAEPKSSDLSLASDKLLNPICEFFDSDSDMDVGDVEEGDPRSSTTAFAAATENAENASSISQLSATQLQDWFRAVPPTVKPAPGSAAESAAGSGGAKDGATGANASAGQGTSSTSSQAKRENLIDDKAAQKISILLQRYRMKNAAAAALPDFDAVAGLRKSILSCNASPDMLDALIDIVTTDSETCTKIAAFVEERGFSALSLCSPEAEHRLVYTVCGVPKVSDRLQCLIFEAQWPDQQRKCLQDLQVLHEGMKVLVAKREVVKKFFQTTLLLGNALNKDSRAPIATRGFRLDSLPKLLQLRSSSKPQATLLHIILSLLDPAEIKLLLADFSALSAAKDRKSAGVHQRCQQL